MAWARIDDSALSHPKIVGMIDWKNPFCLWIWGLSYCQTHLTDGLIPLAALPNPNAARTAPRLVDARLWNVVEGYGYSVHDYLIWNDSKELVTKKRTAAKERIANSRARSSPFVPQRTISEQPLENNRDGSTWRGVAVRTVTTSDETAERAASFIARYPVIYAKARSGASFVVRAARDFDAFLDLVTREKDDTRLDKLFELFLRMKGKDVLNEPGTPRQFAHVFPTCDRILRENNQ